MGMDSGGAIEAYRRDKEVKATQNPEQELAWLLSRRFSVSITAEQVGELIAKDWRKLSLLAHAIHDRKRGNQNG